ncbi:hypothetical protein YASMINEVIRUS_592 [Yasminevirus sp. GU-2018]|uniref:Uncharacterized protein n=1 Tax=Yasminevirus sp. GU-2018 TaxID=2420051 RepID=A0A5K0U7V0_9VIRU|nr:hypothetical protein YASMINEVIRUS_592 [Yasminevirus sp. GU-2018]
MVTIFERISLIWFVVMVLAILKKPSRETLDESIKHFLSLEWVTSPQGDRIFTSPFQEAFR